MKVKSSQGLAPSYLGGTESRLEQVHGVAVDADLRKRAALDYALSCPRNRGIWGKGSLQMGNHEQYQLKAESVHG